MSKVAWHLVKYEWLESLHNFPRKIYNPPMEEIFYIQGGQRNEEIKVPEGVEIFTSEGSL